MKKFFLFIGIVLCCVGVSSFAQAQGKIRVDDIVAKMAKEFNLSEEQMAAVSPIIKEFAHKRQAFLESLQGEAVVNKKAAKATMLQFKQEENERLRQVLTQEQMSKLITKQRLKESLNPDHLDYRENSDDEVMMTPQGGAFQF